MERHWYFYSIKKIRPALIYSNLNNFIPSFLFLGMSRHHYALWVHGEKLVFLLRQEDVAPEDMDKFKPAEFRWRLPEVNDNDWHHYAISVDFPNNVSS